jgi:hypothetical protein
LASSAAVARLLVAEGGDASSNALVAAAVGDVAALRAVLSARRSAAADSY